MLITFICAVCALSCMGTLCVEHSSVRPSVRHNRNLCQKDEKYRQNVSATNSVPEEYKTFPSNNDLFQRTATTTSIDIIYCVMRATLRRTLPQKTRVRTLNASKQRQTQPC